MLDVAGPARTGMEEVWANEMVYRDPSLGISQDRPFHEVVPDFDKYGKYTGTDPYISKSRAAGLGTPTHQLVKLDDGNYYMWNGSDFTKTTPDQIERDYYSGTNWLNQGGRVGLNKGGLAPLLGEPTYQDEDHRIPLSGGGILKLLKLFKKKPEKLENLKDFLERRQFIKNMVGNTPENEKQRILAELKKATEEVRKNPPFKFADTEEIKKEVWKELTKGITKHADGGRVPLAGGKLAFFKGIGKLMDEFFPGTTKIGKRSKPFPEKVQEKMDLRKAITEFQEREAAAKSKITSPAGEGKFTKAEVLNQMFENTIKQSKSAKDKKMFTNFAKEIQGNPELAKDPKVWNFFTGKLPKNQKLVVYADDTVDFWRQSEFGPHNIKTTDEFMKKHPYLTRDQAVKIQNMEPEDQIFEMKRLEAIRNRTTNASGGVAGMLGE
jgi:hypothetical protein